MDGRDSHINILINIDHIYESLQERGKITIHAPEKIRKSTAIPGLADLLTSHWLRLLLNPASADHLHFNMALCIVGQTLFLHEQTIAI